ncbi:hypothetical protein LTSEURB_0563 [Salmonella enterica subsp. enterica serovar Urbana str. R8-2977]|uniref:Transposase n=1 Tax=Salmonella enterica subsp. enterica serovar Urbana str. R8-2977 TaxID=913084 RepID=G5RR47_SALET|nr:hypothetical protein LTSEURB_0563 [Salmonella enterica subsp. enterica serovar Urbana str. R8-2977]
MLGLEPCTSVVRNPESNGIAESFVNYISVMSKPDCGALC